MLDNYSGATRVYTIVGDPIAQVKSPYGVTQAFESQGRDAICVPAHVTPADLSAWWAGTQLARNIDGLIVTVPHKFACTAFCDELSERAAFLGTVNTVRRNAQGRWQGDMFDGLGYVRAMEKNGCILPGKRALLVGAGGAGSAIAHSLVLAGVSELAIHDPDAQRRQSLIERLNSLKLGKVTQGNADPSGFDIAVNATPIGMKASDPTPIDVDKIHADMFVGCVITAPAITPLIAGARAKGCKTVTGADMFAQVRELMVQFLLAA
ncbi:MAG: ThiF family adenylyltransferase [Pseudomonadota bacterium]|nr:ThiF family adenylyltransferase [Pseudomonadota bacterium]